MKTLLTIRHEADRLVATVAEDCPDHVAAVAVVDVHRVGPLTLRQEHAASRIGTSSPLGLQHGVELCRRDPVLFQVHSTKLERVLLRVSLFPFSVLSADLVCVGS